MKGRGSQFLTHLRPSQMRLANNGIRMAGPALSWGERAPISGIVRRRHRRSSQCRCVSRTCAYFSTGRSTLRE
jgi:hypothetical protein